MEISVNAREVLTNQAQMIEAKFLVPEDVVTYACRAFAIGRCDRGFCVAEIPKEEMATASKTGQDRRE